MCPRNAPSRGCRIERARRALRPSRPLCEANLRSVGALHEPMDWWRRGVIIQRSCPRRRTCVCESRSHIDLPDLWCSGASRPRLLSGLRAGWSGRPKLCPGRRFESNIRVRTQLRRVRGRPRKRGTLHDPARASVRDGPTSSRPSDCGAI